LQPGRGLYTGWRTLAMPATPPPWWSSALGASEASAALVLRL
jgi:hypothetical protein